MTGFNELSRRAALTAWFLCLLPVSVFASCWEIAVPGEVITATDIWQIRNHSSGEFSLLGSSGDERHAVSLENIQSLSIDTNIETSWISGNRNAANIVIQFIDGQSITLLSAMTLYYIVDSKRQTLPIKYVISVHRCTDEPTETPPTLLPVESTTPAPILVMNNGDILFGEVTSDQLDWQTSYASVSFKPANIKSIKTSCETPSTGVLETLAGDLLQGRFLNTNLAFHLTTGQVIDIPTDRILMIDFAGTQATEQISALRCNSQ